MTVQMPHTSLEYVYVPVLKAFRNMVGVSPTSLAVDAALMTGGGHPADGDWRAVTWTPDASPATVRVLIGPGGVFTLAAGSYKLWVRVTGATERPTRPVGEVRIT